MNHKSNLLYLKKKTEIPHDPEDDFSDPSLPFFFDFGDTGGSVTISSATQTAMRFSYDMETWDTCAAGNTITVSSGRVYLCAATPVTSLFTTDDAKNAWAFTGESVRAGGYINALLDADNPDDVAYGAYTFAALFYGCTILKRAPDLPSMILGQGCYTYMFYGCTELERPPELPALELTKSCYRYMFYGCTSLKSAPALNAPILADYCYQRMFNLCSLLEEAPPLPALTLGKYSYFYMFAGCTMLRQVVCLATDMSAMSCLSNWLYGVATSGVFVKNPSATWKLGTASGVPSGWTLMDYPVDGEG